MFFDITNSHENSYHEEVHAFQSYNFLIAQITKRFHEIVYVQCHPTKY